MAGKNLLASARITKWIIIIWTSAPKWRLLAFSPDCIWGYCSFLTICWTGRIRTFNRSVWKINQVRKTPPPCKSQITKSFIVFDLINVKYGQDSPKNLSLATSANKRFVDDFRFSNFFLNSLTISDHFCDLTCTHL